ncbi:hypothetical protein GINT2_001069 [Glugoides intestinalis]
MNEKSDDSQNKSIRLLKAELSLLRSHIKGLEKENEVLKVEKSKSAIDRVEVEQEVRKRVDIAVKEVLIAENQKKMFTNRETLQKNKLLEESKKYLKIDPSSQLKSISTEISPKFILDQVISTSNFFSQDALQKLRFFKDYFFDDFFSIPDDKALKVVDFYRMESQLLFLDSYSIFCCKKVVFENFAQYVFDDNSFLKIKVEILETVPPEWVLELLEGNMKNFILINKKRLLRFVCSVAEKCPLHIHNVLLLREFNEIIAERSPIGNKIAYFIIKQGIKGFINETNMHLVPKQFLCLLFPNERDLIDIL